MSVASEATAEIRDFVNNFKADSFFGHPKSIPKFQAAYKQMHSLLIWSLLIERGKFPESEFGLHPKEAISDLAHAFALTTFSLYKPARVMARSGIENIVRTFVAANGGDYQVKSVYFLFDSANDLLKYDLTSKKLLGNLHQIYADLCLTVHSAHEDHVALRIPFEKEFSFDKNQFNLNIRLISRTSTAINQFLFCIFTDKLNDLEHKNRDFILDSLPKLLKRVVQG